MDNAQKAIMIGVGLFITIIIISAVLLIVNLGTGLVYDATAELGTMSSSLQNQILQSYDNKVLSGVQVRSAIQQYMTSTDMTVVLMKDSSTMAATVGAKKLPSASVTINSGKEFYEVTSTNYTANNGTLNRTSMSDFNAIDKVADGVYINTSKNYKSYVLKVSTTDTIVGIVFVPLDKISA